MTDNQFQHLPVGGPLAQPAGGPPAHPADGAALQPPKKRRGGAILALIASVLSVAILGGAAFAGYAWFQGSKAQNRYRVVPSSAWLNGSQVVARIGSKGHFQWDRDDVDMSFGLNQQAGDRYAVVYAFAKDRGQRTIGHILEVWDVTAPIPHAVIWRQIPQEHVGFDQDARMIGDRYVQFAEGNALLLDVASDAEVTAPWDPEKGTHVSLDPEFILAEDSQGNLVAYDLDLNPVWQWDSGEDQIIEVSMNRRLGKVLVAHGNEETPTLTILSRSTGQVLAELGNQWFDDGVAWRSATLVDDGWILRGKTQSDADEDSDGEAKDNVDSEQETISQTLAIDADGAVVDSLSRSSTDDDSARSTIPLQVPEKITIADEMAFERRDLEHFDHILRPVEDRCDAVQIDDSAPIVFKQGIGVEKDGKCEPNIWGFLSRDGKMAQLIVGPQSLTYFVDMETFKLVPLTTNPNITKDKVMTEDLMVALDSTAREIQWLAPRIESSAQSGEQQSGDGQSAGAQSAADPQSAGG